MFIRLKIFMTIHATVDRHCFLGGFFWGGEPSRTPMYILVLQYNYTATVFMFFPIFLLLLYEFDWQYLFSGNSGFLTMYMVTLIKDDPYNLLDIWGEQYIQYN